MITSCRTPRRLAALLVVLLLGCATAACGSGSTGAKGYVDGLGVITQLPVAQRRTPGPVSGTTLQGRHVSLSQYRGKIVVVNIWGSWCPPCRAETPVLEQADRSLTKDHRVVFLGINTRDSDKAQVLAFLRVHHVTYPSIYDPDGHTLLAFHGTLTPSSIPSTLILDRHGRVAASILGQVTSATTLIDLVQDVEK